MCKRKENVNLKTNYDFECLRYMNPLKAYKKGLLPHGLVEACERKLGYNPLGVGKLYRRIGFLRGILWALLCLSIWLFIIMLSYIIEENASLTREEGILFKGVMIAFLIIGFILTFTSKPYGRLEEQVFEIQRVTAHFMEKFAEIFVVRPPSSFKTLQSLCPRVTAILSRQARSIVRLKIIGVDTYDEHRDFFHLWVYANNVGLGFDADVYFNRAKKGLNTYKCFDWMI